MEKKLSIETIKKDIMDALLNNVDVINYFKEYIEKGTHISKLYNNLIFDYDLSCVVGDYIAVEVSEYDSPRATTIGDMEYMVTIKMGLKKEEKVYDMSTVITGIVNKLYPGRKKFSNVPFTTVDNCMSVSDYGYSSNYPIFNTVSLENKRSSQLNRMITFEIEE